MEEVIKKHGFKIILAAVVLIIAILFLMSLINSSNKTKFPLNLEAAEFEFTHVDGSTVSLDNTDGKVRLVYFYFSHCPDVCQPSTYFLSQLQKGLKENGTFGDKALIMSITFDPARDTTERLIEYGGSYGADFDGWYFLRSDDPNYAKQVAHAYDVYVNQVDEENFAHSNFFTLVDRKGKIRKRYSITETLEIDQIVKDMKDLM